MPRFLPLAFLSATLVAAVPVTASADTEVHCPPSVGRYLLDPDAGYQSLDDPTRMALYCGYRDPEVAHPNGYIELQVFWSQELAEGRSPECPTRAANNQTRLSTLRHASVSWGLGNEAAPPELEDVVAWLLSMAEGEAVDCGVDTTPETAEPAPQAAGSENDSSSGGWPLQGIGIVLAVLGGATWVYRTRRLGDPPAPPEASLGDRLAAEHFAEVMKSPIPTVEHTWRDALEQGRYRMEDPPPPPPEE